MRAVMLVQRLSPAAREALASRLGAPSAEVRTLADWMRSQRAVTEVLESCTSQKLQRDLVRICALPSEVIGEEELSAPLTFVELGLLWASGAGYEVQEDLAAALVPNLPGERGSLLTLLARLPLETSHALGRSLEVGPRVTQAEWVLDAAARLRAPEELEARIARLRPADRAVLQEALDAVPLPASKVRNPADAPLPAVSLASGAAGEQGLVFRVALSAKDGAGRLVVPLELVGPMGAILERLPVAAAPAVRRVSRSESGMPRRPKVGRSQTLLHEGAEVPMLALFAEVASAPTVQSPVLRRAKRSQEPEGAAVRWQPAEWVSPRAETDLPEGSLTLRAASAWVKLHGPEEAALVRRDNVLGPAVLESSTEGVVVLRAGVDVTAWLEALVVRIRRRAAGVGAKRDARWDV